MGYQKFRAKRTNGFASKLEKAVYDYLKLFEDQGQISDLKTQVEVRLSKANILYKPDFSYIDHEDDDQLVYAEAKGFETPEWRIKRRLWLAYGPGKLYVYNGSYKRPTLKEVLEPTLEVNDVA